MDALALCDGGRWLTPTPRLWRTGWIINKDKEKKMERETGFEPATLALARQCSTAELFPHEIYQIKVKLPIKSMDVNPTSHAFQLNLHKNFEQLNTNPTDPI